jgi:uncharacterized protein YuzE
MRLHVDKEADALYLRLDDSKIIESEEVSPGVILDYNQQNEVSELRCSICPNARRI